MAGSLPVHPLHLAQPLLTLGTEGFAVGARSLATETKLGQGSLAEKVKGWLFVKQVFSLPPDAGVGVEGHRVSGLQLEFSTHCDEHSQTVPGEPVFRSLISVALGPRGKQMPGRFLSTAFCL